MLSAPAAPRAKLSRKSSDSGVNTDSIGSGAGLPAPAEVNSGAKSCKLLGVGSAGTALYGPETRAMASSLIIRGLPTTLARVLAFQTAVKREKGKREDDNNGDDNDDGGDDNGCSHARTQPNYLHRRY